MTPAEREELPPLDVNADDWSTAADSVHSRYWPSSTGEAAKLACRERQLLAKMSLISSLELTLSNSTNVNVLQMEKIEALAASRKWISVDQELPPIYKQVAAVLYGGVTAGFMSHDGWFVLSESGYQTHNVKLWQPLPAAPTEPTPEESE